jgi:hypothetical protein
MNRHKDMNGWLDGREVQNGRRIYVVAYLLHARSVEPQFLLLRVLTCLLSCYLSTC